MESSEITATQEPTIGEQLKQSAPASSLAIMISLPSPRLA